PAMYAYSELSPDGKRVSVSILDRLTRTRDIWIYDVTRNFPTRFTFDPSNEFVSRWSPDGRRIVFNSDRKGHLDLLEKETSGLGSEQLRFEDGLGNRPVSWSPDGRFILFVQEGHTTGLDLWVLPLFGDRKPLVFLKTPFRESHGQFSPDGRWVAYLSNES